MDVVITERASSLIFLPSPVTNFKTESLHLGGGGAVAQSVERATPGEEILGSITAVAARSLLVGYSVNGGDRSHGLPALSRVWQHVKWSDVSLGTRPRYCLVVDEDVKKPTNQTDKQKPFSKCCVTY